MARNLDITYYDVHNRAAVFMRQIIRFLRTNFDRNAKMVFWRNDFQCGHVHVDVAVILLK